jgi:hypothetical protein
MIKTLFGLDAKFWNEAIKSKISSIEKNKTWNIASFPKGRKTIKSKWLFKIKLYVDGNIEKYNVQLVAKKIFSR